MWAHAERGYVDGQTVRLELRYGEGKPEQLPALAADLVHLKVDVIVAIPNPAIEAARRATQTIPIVMPTAPTQSVSDLSQAWLDLVEI